MGASRPPQPGAPLSDREVEVLAAIAADLSNAEVARQLHVSAGTVKTHMRRICLKLGVQGRAGAVGAGFRQGLLRVERPAAGTGAQR